MSKTKIVVVKLKELLITIALVILAIFLILFGIAWASTKKEVSPKGTPSNTPNKTTSFTSALYTPGVYTSSISIGDTLVHLELVCDDTHINSIRLVNLDEAIATMYPLLSPALEDLELQLSNNIPIEELVITEGSQYTQSILIEAIETTLAKAQLHK